MKTVGMALALVVMLAVSSSANQAINWGTGFDDFRDTCSANGGVRNGNGWGSTCTFDGDIQNVPAGSRGWTVDVAFSTVATWLCGSNVSESHGHGVIVACYNPGGQQMQLSHRHCVIGQ
jgi:hypothetical protein